MIPVKALYDNCEMMLRDKWGYIWGTAGKLWTEKEQEAATEEMIQKYGWQWAGHMVTDCSGVMVYIWKKYGLSIPHGSNSMVRQKYIVDISDTPQAGYAAFVYKPEDNDYSHIGIVGEDGITVYEAKGTQYGFVTSKVTDKKWNRFGRFKDVNYSGGGKALNTPYYATVVTESGNLRVRSGPGTEYPKIGSVSKSQLVIVKKHMDTGWDFIDADSLQGYVSNEYLRPEKEIDDDPTVDPDIITFTAPKETVDRWILALKDILSVLEVGR